MKNIISAYQYLLAGVMPEEKELGSGLMRKSIGHDLFLVLDDDVNSMPKLSCHDYCYIEKDGKRVSDAIFREGGLFRGFGKQPYCQLLYYKMGKDGIDFGRQCIIDDNGQIVVMEEGHFVSTVDKLSYIGGVLAKHKGHIYKLTTMEPIMPYDGRDSIKSDSFMFVECYAPVDHIKQQPAKKQVYKISFATGECEVFE